MEWRLGRGASATPERISLKQLLARGPEGNPNIILTDFELGDNFVYETKNNRWTGVYVPAVPTGDPNAGAGPGRQGEPNAGAGPGRPTRINAVIFSLNVHNEAEIKTILGRRELPALVTNRIRSLGSEEKRLLENSYGAGIDVNKCLIIQEGRTPMSGAILALMFGSGALLLLWAAGLAVAGFIQRGQDVRGGGRRKRREDEEDDEDRPRKRRRTDEDDEEDEEDRPRKRRKTDDDDDDEPRPKRRRSRYEDEP
jgi:hypothetical protein